MKITIAGTPGSGKSTVSREIAERLGLRHYSVGDLMREMARKRKVSVLELARIAEKDGGRVDRELDRMQIRLQKKDNFVIDSRLGFHFIPDSFKVFLKVNDIEAARRIYAGRRKEERENTTLKKTLANIRRREKSERIRYKKYYGVDILDCKKFDLVIDTTGLRNGQAAGKILSEIRRKVYKI